MLGKRNLFEIAEWLRRPTHAFFAPAAQEPRPEHAHRAPEEWELDRPIGDDREPRVSRIGEGQP